MTFLKPEEIADIVYAQMNDDDKRHVRDIAPHHPDGMIWFHQNVGRLIRNTFGLWNPDNPYTDIEAPPNMDGVIDSPLHPDAVSHEILKMVWHKVHAEKEAV